MRRISVVALWVALTAPAHAAQAAQADPQSSPDAVAFFEKKVRPVLAASCYKCHSQTSEKLKGGLKVDSREALLRGGEGGPAVVPGKPDESPLIHAVRYDHDDLRMPPRQKLPDAAVADLEKWVAMGAPWSPPGPAGTTGAAVGGAAAPAMPLSRQANYETLRREHWAWQPVKPAAPPAVKDADWPKDDVDRFVLCKLEAQNLKPAGPADRIALLRRVTFDLTGLPPSPQEVDAFLKDRSADAFEKVVDRLLASPQFGERWGRHWLDVARYGESTGQSRNFPYPNAWRYRDYVIDSFNADKPYDRFLTEQVAGDLLPYKTAEQHNEQLVATGLLAMGIKDLNERDALKFTMDNVDEQIDVVGRAVLATTISCARCHDHKFDPIPTSDYYALAGIFRSTQILSGYASRRGGNNKDLLDRRLLATLEPTAFDAARPTPQQSRQEEAQVARRQEKRGQELAAQLEQARAELRDLVQSARGGKPGNNAKLARPVAGNNLADSNSDLRRRRLRKLIGDRQSTISTLEQQLDALKSGTEDAPLALAVRDVPKPADCPVYVHGETDQRGDVVPRGVIRLIDVGSQTPPAIAPTASGRLELARWLTDPSNPLTARVMVNRIWLHLFGQGLVRTVDNFGTTGEAPSHPELLDHLAARFARDGWSVKKTVRALVLSRTYQLAGTYSAANAAVDPSNQLLWRMAPRRLEAEAIRDAMLAAAGTLDRARPAGSLVANLNAQEVRGVNMMVANGPFAQCRSVYLPILRNNLPAVLDVFDFAEPTMVTGSRDVTTVAPQALFLMNNPFVLEQSKKFAERILAEKQLNDAERVELAYRLTVSRRPTAGELRRVADYVDAFGAASKPSKDSKEPNKLRTDAWATFCQALFASAEFRYLN